MMPKIYWVWSDIIFTQLAEALGWRLDVYREKTKKIRHYLDDIAEFTSKPKQLYTIINMMTYLEQITFFVPVGFRYKAKNSLIIQNNDPEVVLLKKLREKYLEIRALWVEGQILFMYADDYATLNGIDRERSDTYYASLERVVRGIFKPEEYSIFLSSDLYPENRDLGVGMTRDELIKVIWDNKRAVLLEQSGRMNAGRENSYITQKAFEYARKRLEEAFYMMCLWEHVIKLSPVSPSLNDKIDMDMPTLYYFNQSEEAPRMKVTD